MTRKLEIGGYTFKRVEHFKDLEAWVNENANSHEEIRERMIIANTYYFGLFTLFISKKNFYRED